MLDCHNDLLSVPGEFCCTSLGFTSIRGWQPYPAHHLHVSTTSFSPPQCWTANLFLTTLFLGKASQSISRTVPTKSPPPCQFVQGELTHPCRHTASSPQRVTPLNDSPCLQEQMDLRGPQWPMGKATSCLSLLVRLLLQSSFQPDLCEPSHTRLLLSLPSAFQDSGH